MASGYIHISRKDVVFDNDNNVVYWKNGARYLGEIAKAVLNPGEETEVVKYYLKSAVTKKAILIDAGVVVGGGDYYFITDDANFINVRIETADFSSDGGGDGVTVTFLLPESKYYTVYYVEENGDIKLYDVDGDAGTLIPDALPDVTDATAGDALVLDADKKPTWDAIPTPTIPKKYLHNIMVKYSTSSDFSATFLIINDSPNKYESKNELKSYLKSVTNPTTASGVAKIGSKYQIVTRYNTSDDTGMTFNCTEVDFSAQTLTASALIAQWASIANVFDTVIEI